VLAHPLGLVLLFPGVSLIKWSAAIEAWSYGVMQKWAARSDVEYSAGRLQRMISRWFIRLVGLVMVGLGLNQLIFGLDALPDR
jgi:hypothetical protein